jgi:uncharacterized protein
MPFMPGNLFRRRTFVGTAFAGLGITGVSARPPKAKAGMIPMREFGRTGVKLTVVGQAGGRLGLLRTKEPARELVRHAYDLGVNFFDCARAYWDGHSEEVYGDVIPEFRKQVFLTTKSLKRTKKEATDDLDLSLKAMKTDYIDLWQMHSLQTGSEIRTIFGDGGAIEAFEAAKKAGKCRFIGFTGHYDPAVHVAMLQAYGKWDSILMPLNAADPSYLSFEKATLPASVERGIGIQGMKIFGAAYLTRVLNPEDCLRYVLTLPVSSALIGAATIGQLEDDVRFAQRFKPCSPEEMDEMRHRATTGQGTAKGPALEYWKRSSET